MVHAGSGSDLIIGKYGSNRLFGGSGNDRFATGDNIRDLLYGQSGTDKACLDGWTPIAWSSIEETDYSTSWCDNPWAQF